MSDNKPLVSIVLPTYNRSDRLRGAVESCLGQSYSHLELIIVDDASPDATPEVVAELARADLRVKSIRHTVNKKLPAALNTGFATAAGDYLTWTSDDNFYRPGAIARMAAELEAAPEVGMVYAGYTKIDASGNPVGSVAAVDSENASVWNVFGACFLYRRAVSEAVGPYAEDLFMAEDYDYWLRILSRFQMRPIDEDLYLYRCHDQSLTDLDPAGQDDAANRAIVRNLATLRWKDRRAKSTTYLGIASHAACEGDMAAARRYLRVAAITSPTHFLATAPKALVLKALVGRPVYDPLRNLLRALERRPA